MAAACKGDPPNNHAAQTGPQQSPDTQATAPFRPQLQATRARTEAEGPGAMARPAPHFTATTTGR